MFIFTTISRFDFLEVKPLYNTVAEPYLFDENN